MPLTPLRQFLVRELQKPRKHGGDTEIACSLGVSRAVLNHWKKELRPVPDHQLEALAAALGFDLKVMVMTPSGEGWKPFDL